MFFILILIKKPTDDGVVDREFHRQTGTKKSRHVNGRIRWLVDGSIQRTLTTLQQTQGFPLVAPSRRATCSLNLSKSAQSVPMDTFAWKCLRSPRYLTSMRSMHGFHSEPRLYERRPLMRSANPFAKYSWRE